MPDLDLYALLRMSRTAADLGHYNLGKLRNAAVASLANRSLYAETLPGTDRELAEAISEKPRWAAPRLYRKRWTKDLPALERKHAG